MINSISWASYLYALGISICLYYIIVCVLFYRVELQNIFYKLKNVSIPNEAQVDSMPEQYAIEVMNLADDEGNNPAVRNLLLNIQSLAKDAAVRNFTKEQIISSVQVQLQIPEPISLKLKESVNHFIMAACKTYCSIHLEELEVSELWSN